MGLRYYDFFRSGKKYDEEGGPLHIVRALVNVRRQQYGSVVFADNKSKADFRADDERNASMELGLGQTSGNLSGVLYAPQTWEKHRNARFR